jgi:hypothetical protein
VGLLAGVRVVDTDGPDPWDLEGLGVRVRSGEVEVEVEAPGDPLGLLDAEGD